ncbi:hypothetical protein ACFWIA_01135 [Streptomyces sp. NPDC127068]|uniref:hypothetical protein n=1 Tax=Streptomyces sp. NPDC127068 TaxID=3347127 RepID=UPI0036462A65
MVAPFNLDCCSIAETAIFLLCAGVSGLLPTENGNVCMTFPFRSTFIVCAFTSAVDPVSTRG